MPTPKEEIHKLQKQVKADFAAYQAKLCCSAQKVVDLLNDKGGKTAERTILTLGEFRQLLDKRLTEENYLRLKIFAKHLPKSSPASAS
ncbi:hypothetical protein [Oleiharenicola lentus]|uniref:hypothetical protein n=1 Tax=Oleiharenicola lentus TaxID=2508720 RepID=UPI003F6645E2